MKNVSFRIGLLIHDLSSDYSRELSNGIASFCDQNNLMLIIFPAKSINWPFGNYGYQYRAIANHISSHNIDGLIVASGTQGHFISDKELHDYIYSFRPLPIVSIGQKIPQIHSVVVDCKSAINEIVDHLINVHHCKRIALMTTLHSSSESIERTEAYRQALHERNIPIDESIIMFADFTYQTAYSEMEKYYDAYGSFDFDAVIALNDDMAYGIIEFCRTHAIVIPDDLLVMGFDDTRRASTSHPSLCSINQQMSQQGYFAAKSLLDLLLHKNVPLLQKVSTKTFFRQSCGCIDKNDTITKSITVDGTRNLFIDDASTNESEWFLIKDQLAYIMDYSIDMQSEITIDQLRNGLNQDIERLSITAAAIVLFEEPIEVKKFEEFELPDSAYVLTAFDSFRGYYMQPPTPCLSFNPREQMLPDGIITLTNQTLAVASLFHRTLQYGYIVFRKGTFDAQIYELICITLSTIISAASSFTRSLAEKTSLATQNESLTKHNKNLSIISRTDEMTQLLNRRGFLSLGQQTINIAIDMQQTGLLIYGDMDGLKKINDTFGHEVGDRAIKAEAQILRSVFRSSDIIGRMGGDEFAIISVGMTPEVFEKINQRLQKLCIEWNKASNEKFTLSISLGFAVFSINEYAINHLLTEADMCQYEEKRRKKVERQPE